MNATLQQLGTVAKQAAAVLCNLSTEIKNEVLSALADELIAQSNHLIAQNQLDLDKAQSFGISEVMLDRLKLTKQRIEQIAQSVRNIVHLPDPIGEVLMGKQLPNGLELLKKRVPLGVVGIIYESRPDVTIDSFALCFKSSNAVILRGGKEAMHTNLALARLIQGVLECKGLPAGCVDLITDTSRETAVFFMQLTPYLDVLIPRGGAGLIASVEEHAKVPIIKTGVGNCHIYVDADADLQMAIAIIENAKKSRPSACNACESVLVHQDVAEVFLPMLKQMLDASPCVELRGCEHTQRLLGDAVIGATEQDFATEFLDYILSVQVVTDFKMAISHIRNYSTKHSECIVTKNLETARQFVAGVDAVAVYVNASTRFTDGGAFGMGAEIGISTQKLHARGPMGLEALTSAKYTIYGSGQIR